VSHYTQHQAAAQEVAPAAAQDEALKGNIKRKFMWGWVKTLVPSEPQNSW